jgi:hypothetical protein
MKKGFTARLFKMLPPVPIIMVGQSNQPFPFVQAL